MNVHVSPLMVYGKENLLNVLVKFFSKKIKLVNEIYLIFFFLRNFLFDH